MPDSKVTLPEIGEKKRKGEKIIMLTATDCPLARLIDAAGVDIVLVGDSLGMVVLGYTSTVPVTMREMIHHAKAVRRGVGRALLVGDMPFMSFNTSGEQTIRNAGRFLKEAGCDAVKIEGGQGSAESLEAVRMIVDAGIPVMGHLGLTPQTAGKSGGFKVQGKTAEEALNLIEAAEHLESAGCFSVVLECVPAQLAKLVTERLSIPTIGIGAGPDCDGQVLVTHDLVGMTPDSVPKFVRPLAAVHQAIDRAVKDFRKIAGSGDFPGPAESYAMSQEEFKRLQQMTQTQEKNRLIRIGKQSG